jgi:hypothetical protein
MKKLLPALLVSLIIAAGGVKTGKADFPKPSLYPISWEYKFEHQTPKRISVNVPGSRVPQAYWYLPYTVTNETDQERIFLPVFEILTEDGRTIRSDKNIPIEVFQAIKAQEGNRLLLPATQIAGQLRLGPDQAKDGVAIWVEPAARMGHFAVFVQGLSGEAATVKGPDKKDIILRKTLQLNYLIRGDEFFPGEDEVNKESEAWVMR